MGTKKPKLTNEDKVIIHNSEEISDKEIEEMIEEIGEEIDRELDDFIREIEKEEDSEEIKEIFGTDDVTERIKLLIKYHPEFKDRYEVEE